ncbi:hypothetical protein M422DRAFT_24488 [Sphaerobolus stellatus SS14]|nr:hypothetical protein M422DRAFT_24488 [Sphaerobolus stellatus SS14]
MSSSTDRARALIAHKEAIQAELDAQFSILSVNNSTLNSPLVDPEGFPRGDIDVWAVRHARVRIIELRNDMNAVVDQLGKALEQVYDPSNVEAREAASEKSTQAVKTNGVTVDKPFARVDGVLPGSPAAQAGLQREDLFVQFGNLTLDSFPTSTLQPIAEFVAAHEEKTVELVVLRNQTRKTLQLTPRKGWGGRGLLGCHIVPYKQ